VFGIFGASGVLPVLNAYNAELFPTEYRGDAFAWSNNLIGRIGYVLSPMAVGLAAQSVGWGAAVRVTAVFPLIAVLLIFVLLPETKQRELEETAAL
jgi:putative MFS transporter